jgi:hypothetical protein
MATSRRALIGALSVAPFALGAIAAKASTISGSVAWDQTLAAYEQRKAEAEHFSATIYDPLHEKLEPLRPEYTIKHSAKNGSVGTHRFLPGEIDTYEHDGSAWDSWQFIRPEVDALIARHREYERQCDLHGWDRLNDRMDALMDAQCEAERAALATPAPNHAAIMWKLERLFGPDARDPDDYTASWCPERVEQFFEDIRNMGDMA